MQKRIYRESKWKEIKFIIYYFWYIIMSKQNFLKRNLIQKKIIINTDEMVARIGSWKDKKFGRQHAVYVEEDQNEQRKKINL